MKARTGLWASLAIAASVGLAGCGGSSNEKPDETPVPKVHNLAAGHGLTDGADRVIKAGETLKTPTGTLTCPEDGMDCTIKVVAQIDGSYTATSTGGEATFEADPPPTPPETVAEMQMEAYENAKADIEAAATRTAAQAILDGVKDDVTGTQADMLQVAVNARGDEVEKAARSEMQKQELMRLAGMIDTSDLSDQGKVTAARMAIAALRGALDNDSPDVSDDDKAQYETQLKGANQAVTDAQGVIDTETRRSTQMSELEGASTALQNALNAFAGKTATELQLTAARDARADLKSKIDAALDLTDAEKAQYQAAYEGAEMTIGAAQSAYETAETDRTKMETAATAATAKKLYDGINMQAGAVGGGDDDDAAAVNNFNAFYSGDDIHVVIVGADLDDFGGAVPLEADDTTVAANHGWEGKRYTGAAGGDSYEAMVYSNVGAPKEGDKFGQIGVTSAATGYKYGLTADGETTAEFTFMPANVASSDFDQTAGHKEFELGKMRRVEIDGSYHGVPGIYYCTPASDNTCAAQVATKGFNLGVVGSDDTFSVEGEAWTFEPANPEARVTESEDSAYSSYGWWLKKTADDQTYTASAFHDFKGLDTPEIAVPSAGTAKYEGGAAGKYAFSSSTGGLNEAGHFTAQATLNAKFGAGADDDTISGTIHTFKVGDSGEDRTWIVHLHEGGIAATGGIAREDDDGTTWEMMQDDTNASASGDWSGQLREQGTDGVPGAVTGVFYSEYGNTGKMVGAFGATE